MALNSEIVPNAHFVCHSRCHKVPLQKNWWRLFFSPQNAVNFQCLTHALMGFCQQKEGETSAAKTDLPEVQTLGALLGAVLVDFGATAKD